ncbi:hypothetical protein [Streptomyces sp. KN37]|uniref:hypothetical protein n=1 Tax=Streptomyces sp. KN37 TaxID=3090667 RepID=UPI002A74F8D5|nr:hypothetical protein [Streptomyces sp. KN37]WPO75422.1 hypothetical protein R9806_34920 [Streptomyces sp. KN37]
MRTPVDPGQVGRAVQHDPVGPDASAAVTTDTAGASGRTTLLIADDDEVTRSGLRTLLAMQPGLVVVGVALPSPRRRTPRALH